MQPLRYYLRGDFCTILPTSLVDIDVKKIDAVRIFAELAKFAYHPTAADSSSLQAKMSGYGREIEHFDSFGISIVEYQRLETQQVGGSP
jgi:hypothetical protein